MKRKNEKSPNSKLAEIKDVLVKGALWTSLVVGIIVGIGQYDKYKFNKAKELVKKELNLSDKEAQKYVNDALDHYYYSNEAERVNLMLSYDPVGDTKRKMSQGAGFVIDSTAKDSIPDK